jgi:hypothetical protein
MSTRATYRFIPADRRFKPAITLYVHHDGYPEGAANYLQGVSSAEDFIRNNPRAEITLNHEVHGDTEYRYDIIGISRTINAYKREGYGNDAAWVRFFDGSFDEFIEQNLPAIEYLRVTA